jgi:glycosyltransferase involved in cell wall biosynthesis
MNNPKEIFDLSVILPCLNEEKGIGHCLDEVKKTVRQLGLAAEVIVVDNGSTDASAKIVFAAMKDFPELKLVEEKEAGYGRACLAGFKQARGKNIFMADSDSTYDFSEIPLFIEKLDQGYDLVVGNRFIKPMGRGVMPIHHKYIGNPILSFMVRMFFGVKIHDIHCGARAISKQAFERIPLHTGGMEFASEMVIQAARHDLRIGEVSVSYGKRLGTSKLRSVNDGWRHMRFILLYSPLVLFLLPGFLLLAVGLGSMIVLYCTSPSVFGIQLFVHPLFASSLLVIIGYQLVIFALFSKTYAITHLGEQNAFFEKLFKIVTLERALLVGFISALIGTLVYLFIFSSWVSSEFGSLDQIKNSIVALTFVIVGVQTIASAFMLSMLGIQEKTS